jgi:hypothetical protein
VFALIRHEQFALELARALRSATGMTLSRHTQVENLANLLASRRQQVLARHRRDRAYQRLVATILDEPVDGLGTPRPPKLVSPPVRSLPRHRAHAA